MFVVWFATFKMHVQATGNANETISKLAAQTSDSYKKAIEDSQKRNDRLLDLLKDQGVKNREVEKDSQEVHSHLIRILTRMEEKLDQPIRCPMNVAERRRED